MYVSRFNKSIIDVDYGRIFKDLANNENWNNPFPNN
jgi:hypothetical protein